jgi:hypothetical protein
MIAGVAWRNWASLLAQDSDLHRLGQIVGVELVKPRYQPEGLSQADRPTQCYTVAHTTLRYVSQCM